MPSTVKKRSVVVAGHRTSISLEIAFWDALRALAAAHGKTVNQLVSQIDSGRAGNLSSAIRVYVLTAARDGRLPAQTGPGAVAETAPEVSPVATPAAEAISSQSSNP